MRCSRWVRIALMMASVLALAAGQTAPSQVTSLPVGSAIITEVKGEVVFTSPEGAPITAQRGSTLIAESKIETAKGSVLLQLQDGSQVLVKGHSNVVLKAPNEGKGYSLEEFLGQIIVKVQKRLGSAPSFRMGTPSAVITVRGTRFEVDVNKKHKTHVDVFEGLVEVTGILEGTPSILVRPGFSTGVEQDRSPEEPREMNSGEGRDSGLERQGPGSDRGGAERGGDSGREDKPKPGTPTQGGEGKPD